MVIGSERSKLCSNNISIMATEMPYFYSNDVCECSGIYTRIKKDWPLKHKYRYNYTIKTPYKLTEI